MKNRIINLKFVFTALIILTCIESLQSQIEVSGTIKDCEGNLIAGVTVSINKDKSTYTNLKGYYKIIVPDTNTVITYSFFGFQSQKIKLGTKSVINVILKDNRVNPDQRITIKKPVIYLYPTKETDISVKLEYSGKLLFTYPQYNNEWNIVASPNGKLINKNDHKEYAYLFWEGEKVYTKEETVYDNGFVVYKDSIVQFLERKLVEFGFQRNEYNEFIVFWTPYLSQNDWNFIHFRIGKEYEVISRNIINPSPETEIRVFMDFKKIDKPFETTPQKAQKPARKGFTLVEWGGTELKQPIKIKTTNNTYIEK